MLEELYKKLQDVGYNITDIQLDEGKHEYKTEKHKGWYIGTRRGDRIVFTWGNWKTGEKFTQKLGYDNSDTEWKKIQSELDAKYDSSKDDQQKKNAKNLKELYESTVSTKLSTYLSNKGITDNFSSKVILNSNGTEELLIPMYDANGKLWNLQKIGPQGQKSFTAGETFSSGARIESLMNVIGGSTDDIKSARLVLLCEGFATGCSIKMACPEHTVISCIMGSNVTKVAKVLKRKYKGLRFVICADDDYKNTPNSGKEVADEAALAVGGQVAVPVFGETRGDKHTDFNDMHVAGGLERVREIILQSLTRVEGMVSTDVVSDSRVVGYLQNYVNGVQPIPVKLNLQGKPVPPTESEVAAHVHSYYGDSLRKYDDDIFRYDGKVWLVWQQKDMDALFNQVQVATNGTFTTSKSEAVVRAFKKMTFPFPKSPWITNPYLCNTDSGTFHVEKKALVFKPHSQSDMCINKLPLIYDPNAQCPEFLKFLDRVVSADEKELKIKVIQEMYGACLFPIYPKLFLIYGPASSGKTTLIIPAMRLVDKDNWCSVEPSQFQGFEMENMAGKMVNFVTDIDVQKPIPDANIKKIEDRVPIQINRKFQKAILAPIPAIHIFGANDTPMSFEKSEAHTRRWIFIRFSLSQFKEDSQVRDYGNILFDSEGPGIFNWALEGARRLVAQSGKYTSLGESRDLIKKWQLEFDRVGQWLKEVEDGEEPNVSFHTGKDENLSKLETWRFFCTWHEQTYLTKAKIGKIRFLQRLEERFEVVTVQGVRKFVGLTTNKAPQKDE
jgi:phage/plasmid-associated DNA primase/phage/plasmid primase-like uncharacterized protein